MTDRQFAPAVGLHAVSNGVYPPLTCPRCWPDESFWQAVRDANNGSDVVRMEPGPMVHIRAGREMLTPESHFMMWVGLEDAAAWGGFRGWMCYGLEEDYVRDCHPCGQPMANGLVVQCGGCKAWNSFADVRYAGPFDMDRHRQVISDAGWTCTNDGKQALCGACQTDTSITQRAA